MGKRKPHPTRDPESARAYLIHERRDAAAEIIAVAEHTAEVLRHPLAPLTPRERKRALRIATELRPLVARSSPDAIATIDLLMGHWSGPAKRGRRLDVAAHFAHVMLWWAAKYSEKLGQRQLTVTELMAAAVATRVEPASDPRGKLDADALGLAKERMLDAWRKHYAHGLATARKVLEDEERRQEEARRAWQALSPEEQLLQAMVQPPLNPPTRPLRLLRRTG